MSLGIVIQELGESLEKLKKMNEPPKRMSIPQGISMVKAFELLKANCPNACSINFKMSWWGRDDDYKWEVYDGKDWYYNQDLNLALAQAIAANQKRETTLEGELAKIGNDPADVPANATTEAVAEACGVAATPTVPLGWDPLAHE